MVRQPRHRAAQVFSALLLIPYASTFYLPGVAPTSYKQGERVPLHVDRLTPSQSLQDGQVHTALSFDYYSSPFHFCKPEGGPEYVAESLGSILFGDRIQTSPFELLMAQDENCKVVPGCGPQTYGPLDAKYVNKKIYQNFQINWLIDGLPAGQRVLDTTTNTEYYSPGFQLGHMDGDRAVLNNHYDIYIDYHKAGLDQFRVVGILVEPSSNKNAADFGAKTGQCINPQNLMLDESEDAKTTAVFTYSVIWRLSDTVFATRWDKYLHVYDPKIHWFSLINSAIIVVFLSIMVWVILVRTLKRDITRYNRLDEFMMDDMSGGANGDSQRSLDEQEDSGWKLVHGDVFRPPKRALLLSVLLGNGAQLFMMAGFTIAFAMLGFLSPSNRGSVGSVMILLHTLFGVIGGFTSTYTYKCFLSGPGDKGSSAPSGATFKYNIALTPLGLPAVVFSVFFLLNLFLWAQQSSGAVPFTTMVVIVGIWFIISVPLSFLGSWLALRRPPVDPPCRTNQIPRQIPGSTYSGMAGWLNRPIPAMLLTGILPFGAMFVEIHFIMSSLWSARIYYMFGFLFVCYGLMIVTCATVTILSVYFVLCSENYNWQWRSFATGGACAVYVFLNAMVFWVSRLSFTGPVSGVLYLGYSALMSLLVFILTGTIGFFSSWIFVHRIYRSLKVD